MEKKNGSTYIIHKKIYTTLVIFFIANLLFIFLLILPVFRDIKKNSKELVLQKTNLIFQNENVEKIKSNEDFYKNNKENLEKINNSFIDSEVPIEFIYFLENNANDSAVLIDISQINLEDKDKEKANTLSFKVSAKGSFSKFLKFLEKLETSPYLVKISDLDLKKIENVSSNDINITFSLAVLTKE